MVDDVYKISLEVAFYCCCLSVFLFFVYRRNVHKHLQLFSTIQKGTSIAWTLSGKTTDVTSGTGTTESSRSTRVRSRFLVRFMFLSFILCNISLHLFLLVIVLSVVRRITASD